jgi:antirestriction protein ArdC
MCTKKSNSVTTDRIKEITDKLEQGIKDVFDSENYKNYLKVLSKFHRYSLNNTLLIAIQKPEATWVAGFKSWKNDFGRQVRKGERGIKIFAPCPYKIKKEMDKIDPLTQKLVYGSDGNPIRVEIEVTIPAFKVVSVFDVSQTDGKELPSIEIDELTGSINHYGEFITALERASPAPILYEAIETDAKGYYNLKDKRIVINTGMSELQTMKTVIHEIAHAKLHDIDITAPRKEWTLIDKNTREVQAESVAYTVCQYYGLDTSEYSFVYVATWSKGREMSELKASLEVIHTAACELINKIDSYMYEPRMIEKSG